MREALGRYAPFGQSVVADGGGRCKALFHIALIEQLLAAGVMSPDARETVGL